MEEFLKRIAGSREDCFFDTSNPKVNASAVCHEVRSLGIAAGDKISISFKDLRRNDTELFVQVGELCELKSLPLDTTVQVRIWVSRSGKSFKTGSDGRRACGEIRIPVQRLVEHLDGALYHSWVMLESPGLQDSVASMGLFAANGDGEAFDQALLNGPRQLLQPKACFSICRSEEVNAAGKILYTMEATNRDRIARWGPLLRSQQQHIVMCNMQHARCTQLLKDQSCRETHAHGLGDIQEQMQRQAHEIETLQEYLADRERSLQLERSRRRDRDAGWSWELRQREERVTQQAAEVAQMQPDSESCTAAKSCQGLSSGVSGDALQIQLEIEGQHDVASNLKQELENLQSELMKIDEEANRKIEAANERIWALRQDRDEAVRETEAQSAGNYKIWQEMEELTMEKKNLVEQKEALLAIVEDLHQTCVNASLPMGGRNSVDSITGGKIS